MAKPSIIAIADALNAITERYLNSDIHDAAAALGEAEMLLRGSAARLPSSEFALALILAKRSDIALSIGDSSLASKLLDEAVVLFQKTSLGKRAGLCSSEAVLAFIREQDAKSRVKWRQRES